MNVRERNTTFQIGDGGKDKGEPWAERRAAAGVAYIDGLQSTLQGVNAQLSWCRLCLFVADGTALWKKRLCMKYRKELL